MWGMHPTPAIFKNVFNVCNLICQTLLMVSVAYSWSEADPGSRMMRCMHPPPAIFKNVFDVCNFSIISNLFDCDKSHALSTHNQKCANKTHHIWRST